MLSYSSDSRGRESEITGVFLETFTASEGEEEGALVAGLAEDLMRSTKPEDLRVNLALDGGAIVGAIMFSRLWFEGDARRVFLLSPVAVLPECQGQWVGTTLLTYGLGMLRAEGVDAVISYGDPAYYARVGFAPIRPEDVPPPMHLRMPEGWIGQSLTDAPLGRFTGPSRSVAALSRPRLW